MSKRRARLSIGDKCLKTAKKGLFWPIIDLSGLSIWHFFCETDMAAIERSSRSEVDCKTGFFRK
jgi:hypothetical protein